MREPLAIIMTMTCIILCDFVHPHTEILSFLFFFFLFFINSDTQSALR